MHELTITQSMIDIVLEQAEKAGAQKVERINLTIGEMSGFVEEAVRFYFEFLAKGTPAEEASLCINQVAGRARCHDCGAEFSLKELDWTCPVCGSNNIEITAGRELFVESIEVE
jgi:hydrogenase nickel incorporation protein HypA/HybF